MNIHLLVKRLKQLRENYGWTQQKVANKTNLSRSAIAQIEAGKRNISTFEISQFAELYQKPISFFLSASKQEEDDFDAVLFRALPVDSKAKKKVKEKINYHINLCSEGFNLRKMLGISGSFELPSYSQGDLLTSSSTIKKALEEGSKVAEQERKRLELGNNPIGNIVELLSNQNIWVCSTDLPKNISGLFLNNIKFGFIILVNANEGATRKRFSYAHEYAHALFDRDRPIQVSSSENQTDLIEKRANAFAAAFLMPAQGVDDFLSNMNKGQPSRRMHVVYDILDEKNEVIESRAESFSQQITFQDVEKLARHFGVSYQTAVYRLLNLGHFSSQKCNELLKDEKRRKYYLRLLNMEAELDHIDKKSLWDRELREDILYFSLEAYRREEISKGKLLDLAEMLNIDSNSLLHLIEVSEK